jgi:hypothetical protein
MYAELLSTFPINTVLDVFGDVLVFAGLPLELQFI